MVALHLLFDQAALDLNDRPTLGRYAADQVVEDSRELARDLGCIRPIQTDLGRHEAEHPVPAEYRKMTRRIVPMPST